MPQEKVRHLVDPTNTEFLANHRLSQLDAYRTNQSLEVYVFLAEQDLRRRILQLTPVEFNSIYSTLHALGDDDLLHDEFTTRAENPLFESNPPKRMQTAANILIEFDQVRIAKDLDAWVKQMEQV